MQTNNTITLKPKIGSTDADILKWVFVVLMILFPVLSIWSLTHSTDGNQWIIFGFSILFIPLAFFMIALLHKEIHIDTTNLVITRPYMKYFKFMKNRDITINLGTISKILIEKHKGPESILHDIIYWVLVNKNNKTYRVPFHAQSKNMNQAINLLAGRHIFIINRKVN